MNPAIKDLLLTVDKPARYCGGEFNTPEIKENPELRFLMCFPDVYEMAHSNLGIKILYYMLNNRKDTACESCYMPWVDMVDELKRRNMPLFSQETHSPVCDFDAVGFSLQYEMSYTNVLAMLDLGNIPVMRRDRDENCPIVIAGGPCVVNPMPLTEFIDVFSIGDGEEAISRLADVMVNGKKCGKSRSQILS